MASPARFPIAVSVTAACGDNDPHRAGDDREITPEAPVLDVLMVETDSGAVIDVVAAADLPGAGKSWPGPQVMADILAVFRHLGRDNRTGADKAHLALQDVQQLWELVDAGFAHGMTERRNTRVALELLRLRPFPGGIAVRCEMALKRFVRIDHHGAKFEAIEWGPVQPDTAVTVKDWAAIGELDRQRDQTDKRQQHDDRR